MREHRGRLELTWTNKDQRLLAREDGGYEWVPPQDYRVREVRLLRDAGAIGEVGPERAKDNLLIRGDSLHALTSLVELPEFRDELVGRVKLVYIDPPFNTGQAFAHYDDGLEHSVWLTMMRDRLVQLKALLSPDGSIWVHLDDSEMAYCRVLMDEVFGRENFIGRFQRSIAYGGWRKSVYPQVVFDSGTERALAVLLDGDEGVAVWVRLTRGDLPILWGGAGHEYNPDFLVVDGDDRRWLIETKADRDLERADVQAKRQAALVWTNTVNGSDQVADRWEYLLVSESDLAAAKGSWSGLLAATRL